jgi:uncharacterized membrane protein YqjE
MVRDEIAGRSSHDVGLLDSLKGLARTALEILHSRLELVGTEIAEEQARLIGLALIAAMALLAVFLGLVFVAFLVVAAFWDTPYRLLATALIAGALVAAGAGLWLLFLKKAKAKGKAFVATLHELATDIEHLR